MTTEARRRHGRGGSSGEPPPEDEQVTGPPGDPEAAARTICLRLLDQRARTRSELAQALARRGIPDEAAEVVLARFAEVGLIDDAALANGLAMAQHRERGLAGRAAAVKLRRRGIDDDTIRTAVDQIDTASERATAERLVAKKLTALRGVGHDVAARRLVGMLARKGYSPGLAHEVVRAAVAGTSADDVIGDPDLDGWAH